MILGIIMVNSLNDFVCAINRVIINIILAQFDSTRWLAIILSQNGELEVYDERVQDERKDIINNLTKKI